MQDLKKLLYSLCSFIIKVSVVLLSFGLLGTYKKNSNSSFPEFFLILQKFFESFLYTPIGFITMFLLIFSIIYLIFNKKK